MFLAFSVRTRAANYITVATIGAVPQLDEKQDPQSLVNQVITFWQKELAQVLPDKPDLIVLPEFCDLSGAGDEYLKVRKNQIVDFFSSVPEITIAILHLAQNGKTIRDFGGIPVSYWTGRGESPVFMIKTIRPSGKWKAG